LRRPRVELLEVVGDDCGRRRGRRRRGGRRRGNGRERRLHVHLALPLRQGGGDLLLGGGLGGELLQRLGGPHAGLSRRGLRGRDSDLADHVDPPARRVEFLLQEGDGFVGGL